MVRIRVGGDLGGDWQEAAPRSCCRASRDWRCVCVCGLLELFAKACQRLRRSQKRAQIPRVLL
jgi:hypothetical protein